MVTLRDNQLGSMIIVPTYKKVLIIVSIIISHHCHATHYSNLLFRGHDYMLVDYSPKTASTLFPLRHVMPCRVLYVNMHVFPPPLRVIFTITDPLPFTCLGTHRVITKFVSAQCVGKSHPPRQSLWSPYPALTPCHCYEVLHMVLWAMYYTHSLTLKSERAYLRHWGTPYRHVSLR